MLIVATLAYPFIAIYEGTFWAEACYRDIPYYLVVGGVELLMIYAGYVLGRKDR